MANQKDFDKVLSKLQSAENVKGTLQLTECGEIQAILGFNYSDDLGDDVCIIGESIDINIEVMADSGGYKIISKSRF